MNTPSIVSKPTTRREFLGGAAALAACLAIPRSTLAADAKPNSVIDGVRIGTITYSYRGFANTAEETLAALLKCGLSECELMGGPIQAYTGIGKKKGAPTDSEREEQLAKCKDLRKMFNDAGVNIHLHKLGIGGSDEEIEFSLMVAKALGAVGCTTERNDALAKKLAPFTEKHKIWVAFHNHTGNIPQMDQMDPLFEISPYIGFNLDIGHYVAGSKGKSPIPVLEKYHSKILSLHLKDRTADGGNVAWGQGQTPIKEVLQLIRKQKWTFPADIELEYKIPQGSDAVTEVGKCFQFCKQALA